MEGGHWAVVTVAVGSSFAALTVYPYTATAIAYRGSDNGLAYILFVMGVGIWNAMFAAQLLDADPTVKGFFLTLSVVGASLAGLGWFLFAATASSTIEVSNSRLAYGIAALLAGLDISLVMTNPAHERYWELLSTGGASPFVAIDPNPLYWFHALFLVALFAAGSALFAEAWHTGIKPEYSRAYTIAGAVTILAIVGSDVVAPGGASIAPIVAASLTTIGWLQATRGRAFSTIRSWLGSG